MTTKPSTILITGAAGEIGSRLARRLHDRGHQVRALVLPGDSLVGRLAGTATVHFGDVTKPETLAEPLQGVDVVYHLAAVLLGENADSFRAVNVEGTRHVVDAAAAAQVGHLIHISSASVVYPRTTHYSRSKQQAEEIVRACGSLNFTLVRPTLVYDREGGLEFKMYADFVKRYPILPLLAGGRARKRPVHVDDLLSGLVAMAANPVTYGKTYNFSGGEEISIRDLAKLMLKSRGLSKPFVCIPVPVCRLLAFVMEHTMKRPPLTNYAISRILHDAALDCGEARADLGYDPAGVRSRLVPNC